jgi:hypothetical protein
MSEDQLALDLAGVETAMAALRQVEAATKALEERGEYTAAARLLQDALVEALLLWDRVPPAALRQRADVRHLIARLRHARDEAGRLAAELQR